MIALPAMAGGADAFDGLLYPPQHHNTNRFLQTELQKLQQLATNGGEILQGIYQTAMQKWNDFQNGASARIAQAARRAVASMIGDVFTIYPMASLEIIQQASPVMQRWIMTMPDIRTLHHRNACSAYDGNYVDHHPGVIGMDHYDYRRVMDGVVVQTDTHAYSTTISEELYEGDSALSFRQQIDILDTWEAMKQYIELGYDPSSPSNAKL